MKKPKGALYVVVLKLCPNPNCYEPWDVRMHDKKGQFSYVWCRGCGMRGPMKDGHPDDAAHGWNNLLRDWEEL